jgi:hydroxymethylbilane synthase
MSVVRIATRASALALAQARSVAADLSRRLGLETELVRVQTTGDRTLGSLAKLGGKGLFVKEIEEALLTERADLAVHSAKDLPARLAPGLVLAAIPEREDPRDALVVRGEARCLDALPAGARVGTGSLRRAAQLLSLRPDLQVLPLRGNVDTRLRKLDAGEFDALVLACAGLVRLSLPDRIAERIPTTRLLPAVGQGALALQTRKDDPRAEQLAALEDVTAARVLAAERAFLDELDGDCNVPLAALAEVEADARIRVRGLVADPDGGRVLRSEAVGPVDEPEAPGRDAARHILEAGGGAILAALREGTAGAGEA